MENRRQTHASATLYPNVAAYLQALTGARTLKNVNTHTHGCRLEFVFFHFGRILVLG